MYVKYLVCIPTFQAISTSYTDLCGTIAQTGPVGQADYDGDEVKIQTEDRKIRSHLPS